MPAWPKADQGRGDESCAATGWHSAPRPSYHRCAAASSSRQQPAASSLRSHGFPAVLAENGNHDGACVQPRLPAGRRSLSPGMPLRARVQRAPGRLMRAPARALRPRTDAPRRAPCSTICSPSAPFGASRPASWAPSAAPPPSGCASPGPTPRAEPRQRLRRPNARIGRIAWRQTPKTAELRRARRLAAAGERVVRHAEGRHQLQPRAVARVHGGDLSGAQQVRPHLSFQGLRLGASLPGATQSACLSCCVATRR